MEVKKHIEKINLEQQPKLQTNPNEPGIPEGFKHKDNWWTNTGLVKYDPDADQYFNSQAHFGIHEDMIKDRVRTDAYRDSILKNAHLFRDKVVLDVGCGTGILSMFCAQAGAKYVYAVEFSDIAAQATEIIKLNKQEDTIQIVKSKVEDIKQLPGPQDKVDIIVSEWMGYFLLQESMLDSVLQARDKFLKPNGLMFPDQAIIQVGAIQDHDQQNSKINFWNKVYDFDMSCIKEIALTDPLIDQIPGRSMISDHCEILNIDLLSVKKEELDFVSRFKFTFNCKETFHALVCWFDCYFNACEPKICLSTSPQNHSTHWKQVILQQPEPLKVFKGDVMQGWFAGHKSCVNPREIDIKIKLNLKNSKHELEDKVMNFRVR